MQLEGISVLFSFIGGLGMFLYGMHVMANGLQHFAGGKMQRLMSFLTQNRLMAILVGTLVTAVTQSSSATTVMVVGFVNAGMLNLSQAVGVIMGANIGTTITAWLVSLSEFGSFLNPEFYAPLLLGIGAFVILFAKSDKKKQIGEILIGFAVLFIGLSFMSDAIKPYRDSPIFSNAFTMLGKNPLLAILTGTVVTAIIQSSSASVGILQTLAMNGIVNWKSAVFITLGQNIGTCVTAMISGIGASRNAKRAALIHLYFNIIGTILFLGVFYTVNAIHPFAFLGEVATPFGIAVVHSCFNIAATLVLLPFSNGLVKLACLTLPTHEDVKEMSETDKTLSLLDVRFLEKPAYAVEQSRLVASVMADKSREAMDLAMELLHNFDEAKAEQVAQMETDVDRFEDELGTYLVKLSSKQLSNKDSETLNTILHCIGDFERISDHARNIKEAAQEMHDKQLVFSEKAQEELKVFERAVHDVLDLTMTSFKNGDLNLARQVEPLEEVIDGLSLDVKQRHVRRLRKGKCTIELGFILSDVITNFERVSDHCSNIAVCLVQVNEDEFDTHAYLDELRQEDNKDFQSKVLACREKYQLPPTKQERLAEKNAKLLAE